MIVNGIQFYAIRPNGNQRWHLTLQEPLKAPDVDPTNAQILFGGSTTGNQAGYVSSRSTNNGGERWRYTFAPVNGRNHFVDTRARFTPDGTTAYISTFHGTDNVYENASLFHALDITPGGDCAVPADVQAVGFRSDATRLEWDPVEPDAEYDVLRADLAGLPGGEAPGCLGTGLNQTWLDDFDTPLDGQGYCYVVRGRNGCGNGSWGRNPDGEPRQYGACP